MATMILSVLLRGECNTYDHRDILVGAKLSSRWSHSCHRDGLFVAAQLEVPAILHNHYTSYSVQEELYHRWVVASCPISSVMLSRNPRFVRGESSPAAPRAPLPFHWSSKVYTIQGLNYISASRGLLRACDKRCAQTRKSASR